ncbi:MAG: hypothetical protein A2Y15_06675 [Clostridiales bacterium GWF2_36_10]|nr:MAG: hypothetical protein A2Y15_06675 [Clostridiales bacterium GWF2_36_10]HAN21230.1 hypothetical protein [Clostridiales bacterium]
MKKCKKCGIVQNDERTICIECGNFLGKPLSKEESKHYNEEITDKVNDLTERADDFYITSWDKIMGGLCFGGIIYLAAFLPFFRNTYIPHLYNSYLKEYLFSIIFLTYCLLMTVFPKFILFLQRLRFIFFDFSEDPSPSAIYLIFTKIIRYLFFVVGYMYVILSVIEIIQYFYKCIKN